MGGVWDSLHSHLYDKYKRESPGKQGCDHFPSPALILDTHSSGLHQLFSCQNPACDFHIAGTTGLWAGISGKSSYQAVCWGGKSKILTRKHLALPLTSCVNVTKLLNLSEPSFSSVSHAYNSGILCGFIRDVAHRAPSTGPCREQFLSNCVHRWTRGSRTEGRKEEFHASSATSLICRGWRGNL